MTQYKDGQPAVMGDIIKGWGTNITHELVGRVIEVRQQEIDNLTIEVFWKNSVELSTYFNRSIEAIVLAQIEPTTEHGEAKNFEKI